MKACQEAFQTRAISVGAGEEGVVVAAAEFDELFRFAGGSEKTFGVAHQESIRRRGCGRSTDGASIRPILLSVSYLLRTSRRTGMNGNIFWPTSAIEVNDSSMMTPPTGVFGGEIDGDR